MFDRHLLGDVALAVLIAIPASALARPAPVAPVKQAVTSAPTEKPIVALASASERQIGLFR